MSLFIEAYNKGLPFCVIKYYTTELISGWRERRVGYQMIARTSAESMMLGFRPEAEIKRYDKKIAYYDMNEEDIRDFRRHRNEADSAQDNEYGGIWWYNGLDYHR